MTDAAPEVTQAASEIAPGLYVGGADAADGVDAAGFDVVVRCATVRVAGCADVVDAFFPDAWMGGFSTDEQEVALGAAVLVADARSAGKRVLVVCREGRNRSCLVAALALMQTGTSPLVAIELVRERRVLSSGPTLANRYFEQFLLRGGKVGLL